MRSTSKVAGAGYFHKGEDSHESIEEMDEVDCCSPHKHSSALCWGFAWAG